MLRSFFSRARLGASFLAGALLLFGCSQAPIPTSTVSSANATAPAPTSPPTSGPTAAPTQAPTSPAAPTAAAAQTAAAPTAAPTLTRTPAAITTFTKVKIFLVAIGDNGKSGKKIGCDDSVVAVERTVSPTTAPLTAALKELLSIQSQYYGMSGLYDALYQSNLKVDSVTITSGKANINLTGTLRLGGECDDPRVAAQIEETALQFSTVKQVAATINGIPLSQVLSEK